MTESILLFVENEINNKQLTRIIMKLYVWGIASYKLINNQLIN